MRVLLAVSKMEESCWERCGAWSKRGHNRRRRRVRREQRWGEAGEIALFSMLRREFEAVVSMLMSVPRFFVRGRGAQPLNYFKYFRTFVARGD